MADVIRIRHRATASVLALAWLLVMPVAADAFVVELNDVAPMRVEWQRMYSRGQMPLPGTPDLSNLEERLKAKGMKAGAPIFIRVLKAESELELWMLKGERYELFETYPICHWSGSLGPKMEEGDKQNPEGFYSISRRQLRRAGKWPRSINVGFPNLFDRAHERTGSYILVHGGCSSVGCFAMTDKVMKEIHELAIRAIRGGQDRFQFHIFPFRMTDANLAIFKHNPWYDFWANLKRGYDNFERNRVPPKVSVCGLHYLIEDAGKDEIAVQGRMQRLRPQPHEDGGDNRCVEDTPQHAAPARSPDQAPGGSQAGAPVRAADAG